MMKLLRNRLTFCNFIKIWDCYVNIGTFKIAMLVLTYSVHIWHIHHTYIHRKYTSLKSPTSLRMLRVTDHKYGSKSSSSNPDACLSPSIRVWTRPIDSPNLYLHSVTSVFVFTTYKYNEWQALILVKINDNDIPSTKIISRDISFYYSSVKSLTYHIKGWPSSHYSWIHKQACVDLYPHNTQLNSQDSGDAI